MPRRSSSAIDGVVEPRRHDEDHRGAEDVGIRLDGAHDGQAVALAQVVVDDEHVGRVHAAGLHGLARAARLQHPVPGVPQRARHAAPRRGRPVGQEDVHTPRR